MKKVILSAIIIFLLILLTAGIVYIIMDARNDKKSILPFPEADGGNGDDTPATNCNYVDIAQRYRDFFGNTFINAAENSCETAGGSYMESDDISGCAFDPTSYSVDCDNAQYNILDNFCSDTLKAQWVCDNSKGFIGCVCNNVIPTINCEWKLLDQLVGEPINPGQYKIWGESLPTGRYKFEWNYNIPLFTYIGSDSEQFFSATTPGGVQEFYIDDAHSGRMYGIAIQNNDPLMQFGIANIRFYQWVCDNYQNNWDCDIFDNEYQGMDEPQGLPDIRLGDIIIR